MDKTDATLKALEKQIKATYTKAYQEMKKEMTDILSKIEVNPEMSLAQKMALMTKYDRLNTLSTQLANTAYNANTMAQKMINNEMVNVYDINYNGDAERLGFGLIDHTAIKKVLKQEENPFNMISSLRDKEGIRNQMKGQLLSGLLKGESMQKIARRLKDVSEKSLKDCIRIARTETTRVQNSAKMDIGKHGQELGFEMWKRWVATTDGRVREDHLAMNGVEVPQDEPFVLPDGSKMMFPADISLGADVSQVVNCRCTMIEFRKEVDKEENDNNQEKRYVPKRPQRPQRKDYNDEDKYFSALEKYKEERKNWNKQIDELVNENIPNEKTSIEQLKIDLQEKGVVVDDTIKSVDGRMITSFEREFETLSKEYPEVLDYQIKDEVTGEIFDVKYKIDFDKNGDFLAEASTGFTFGKRFEDAESLVRGVLEMQSDGYLVDTGRGVLSVFDHEFGHKLYHAITHSKNHYMTTEERVAFDRDIVSMLKGKKGISEYATTNVDELFAEGFAAYQSREKTEFAKSFGELLSKWRK